MASLNRPSLEQMKPQLRELLSTVYPDWPKKGVLFRDIMPLFQKPDVIRNLSVAIADHCRSLPTRVDAVAGLEARGFLFGPMVAVELNVPFVPIRKKGKLPGEVLNYSYLKEYGPVSKREGVFGGGGRRAQGDPNRNGSRRADIAALFCGAGGRE